MFAVICLHPKKSPPLPQENCNSPATPPLLQKSFIHWGKGVKVKDSGPLRNVLVLGNTWAWVNRDLLASYVMRMIVCLAATWYLSTGARIVQTESGFIYSISLLQNPISISDWTASGARHPAWSIGYKTPNRPPPESNWVTTVYWSQVGRLFVPKCKLKTHS